MTYFFDLSTSARWAGHAVGIVRVERELARRGLARSEIRYCVYVAGENAFYELKRSSVEEILAGRLCIEFNPAPPPAPAAPNSPRFVAREAILRVPRLYQLIQRLKGRSFSLQQIANIRRDEALSRRERTAPQFPIRLPLSEVSEGPISLGPKTTIISGGLDWEYKDLRAIYDLKKVKKFRYAAIVYDLIPHLFPHFVVPSYVGLLKDYFGELFWTADYCMCISEATRNDMLAFCASNGMKPPPSASFPLGCDVPEHLEETTSLPAQLEGKRYAIFVSTIEPRKNHRTLYAAWARGIERGAIDPQQHRLVFVGRVGWATGDLLQEIDNNPLVEDTIIRLANVSDAELIALYRGAEFGLFPSFYEGYGLPLAEMLNHGKACISSRSGSLEEVGGEFVQYVDPIDVIAWSEQIARFFNDPEARLSLEKRVADGYSPVTWDDAAPLFFERLKSLT